MPTDLHGICWVHMGLQLMQAIGGPRRCDCRSGILQVLLGNKMMTLLQGCQGILVSACA